MITSLLELHIIQTLALNQPKLNLAALDNSPKTYATPIQKSDEIAPYLNAKAILSIDLDSNQVLFKKNANQKLPIASLTKLMTLLIILEENKVDEIVTVKDAATRVDGTKLGLRPKEKITVLDLIKATLIESDNDAAAALALHNAETFENFAIKMNTKAKELGLNNTHFVNPTGLDEENHFSSAADLAILAKVALKNQIISQIVQIRETDIKSESGYSYNLKTTNELLGSYLKVYGLKTGTTDLAGQCLITVVESPDGHRILNILLSSPERFQETKTLSEWAFNAFNWL